ncbi:MAG: HupE/UreJ family protein [Pseudomonadota bacterium]
MASSWPAGAFAHTADSAQGFLTGLLHPVFGPDHFLAMLSVGIVSAQLGRRYVWIVPAVFVTAMIVGAVFGIYGHEWPATELGIALSVLVLGIAIMLVRDDRYRWPIMLVTALFGSLHGHAHGLEMPGAADPVFYAGGFLTGTTAIHILGVAIGHGMTVRGALTRYLRILGCAIAIVGVVFVAGSA